MSPDSQVSMNVVLVVGVIFSALLGVVLYMRRKMNESGNILSGSNIENLQGKIIVVTGGSNGIGKALVSELAGAGAKVVNGSRRLSELRTGPHPNVSTQNEKSERLSDNIHLDLSSFKSIETFFKEIIQKYGYIDILINNAACMGPKRTSDDNIDYCFQVNYLGHFFLSKLFINNHLKNENRTNQRLTIINLASNVFDMGSFISDNDITSLTNQNAANYTLLNGYANSKLCMILFSTELDRRYRHRGIQTIAVHPGYVKTGLQKHYPGLVGVILRCVASKLFRTPEEAVKGILFCCVREDKAALCGKVLFDGRLMEKWYIETNKELRSQKKAIMLWELSEKILESSKIASTDI
ncbi:hypothetical protein HELRODRAFT_176029 [Helobdella robusta]|uniref:Uncharacterized protein n=1 Tax=Helobdella robusta TaxID=6412 RepID=T1FA19_HELRO|nr:hypothetical protein HELRODRAFT_176029 [Helobdella robusta]ESO00195.1 hypothetical protein HELRODRAFT_176029 [Helobdella robusta]